MAGFTILVIVIAVAIGMVSGIIVGKKEYDNGFDKGAKITKTIYGIDETRNPKKCKVCGHVFDINKSEMYITREEEEIGFAANLGTKKEPKLYEVIDCPKCGCQNLLGIRQRPLYKKKEAKEEIQIIDLSKD